MIVGIVFDLMQIRMAVLLAVGPPECHGRDRSRDPSEARRTTNQEPIFFHPTSRDARSSRLPDRDPLLGRSPIAKIVMIIMSSSARGKAYPGLFADDYR